MSITSCYAYSFVIFTHDTQNIHMIPSIYSWFTQDTQTLHNNYAHQYHELWAEAGRDEGWRQGQGAEAGWDEGRRRSGMKALKFIIHGTENLPNIVFCCNLNGSPPRQTQNGQFCWEQDLDSSQAFSMDVVWRVQLQMSQKNGKEWCCFCPEAVVLQILLIYARIDLLMILMITVFTHSVTQNLNYAWYAFQHMILRVCASKNWIYAWYYC
jgi:hypothetical protein